MLENVYYVYTYSFNDEVFYVGKGKGNRLKCHIWETQSAERAKKNKVKRKWQKLNISKINKIKGILELGQLPVIEKVYENLSEQEAFDFEIMLIQKFGRVDLGTGTLLNMTSGGEGGSGHISSEEKKRKIGLANKGRKFSDEIKLKLSIAQKGKLHPKQSETQSITVYQFTKQGVLIKEWSSGLQASIELKQQGVKTSQQTISECCRHVRRNSSGGFIWRFEKEFLHSTDFKL